MTKKRFAFEYLKPIPGKFWYHAIGSAIGLFVIVILLLHDEEKVELNFENGLELFAMLLSGMIVFWGIAYLIDYAKRKFPKDDKKDNSD